ncbi:Dienelactone hydrolase family protein [Rhodovastum atsumiense]|uniref:Dienelactone hydrolase family protein n=1 Tax=Rhodovastum atsumiense TaxID=504468 RepID=A0A5M6IPJ2_9PROT|nr:dienelactone hydrolase family protein [Rhodovastum atsumiense]KAA5610171.1 dienelactone hydrolase family protein [Rhodovastum atsumiense]CAH2599264.1 Dienelactone hydrolase family protein [Rhodovastum atsumiense]
MRIGALLFLMVVVAGGVRAETVRFAGGGGALLEAVLFRPEGPPRAPAVVALHGCAGPLPARDHAWARHLAGLGHLVLLPDSFGSRGLGSQCRTGNRSVTASGLRRDDALAAARWLADQPGTPAGGVAVLGWSDGGSTVLATAAWRQDNPPGLLRGFVAFYPGCRQAALNRGARPVAPVLLLIGEADDWTPAAPCRDLAGRVGPRITLVTYPGAWHDFDAAAPLHRMRDIPRSQNPDHGVHAGQDPAAREDAFQRVPAFLDALPPAP